MTKQFGKKEIANLLFGKTEEGCCIVYKKEVLSFRDELSQREFAISGFCQNCQDTVFGKEEKSK